MIEGMLLACSIGNGCDSGSCMSGMEDDAAAVKRSSGTTLRRRWLPGRWRWGGLKLQRQLNLSGAAVGSQEEEEGRFTNDGAKKGAAAPAVARSRGNGGRRSSVADRGKQ
jgi:hypothetical protein